MDDTLIARVPTYARRRLADLTLTPERIAAEARFSVRRLHLLLTRRASARSSG